MFTKKEGSQHRPKPGLPFFAGFRFVSFLGPVRCLLPECQSKHTTGERIAEFFPFVHSWWLLNSQHSKSATSKTSKLRHLLWSLLNFYFVALKCLIDWHALAAVISLASCRAASPV